MEETETGGEKLTTDFHQCDRRLSRAAREILRVHLVQAWNAAHAVSSEDERFNLDVSQWNVWQLLEAITLSPLAAAQEENQCPLLPERHVGKRDEEQSLEADATAVSRTARQGVVPGWMYKEEKPRRLNLLPRWSVAQSQGQ